MKDREDEIALQLNEVKFIPEKHLRNQRTKPSSPPKKKGTKVNRKAMDSPKERPRGIRQNNNGLHHRVHLPQATTLHTPTGPHQTKEKARGNPNPLTTLERLLTLRRYGATFTRNLDTPQIGVSTIHCEREGDHQVSGAARAILPVIPPNIVIPTPHVSQR